MTRKELIAVADQLSNKLEEANLAERFSPALGEAVNNYEWMVHFEGHPNSPQQPPVNGGEAHARLMNSLAYVLAGELEAD